ncbi:hypothetical protein ACLB2K_007481 [Fragaria x ananassa]
MWTFPKSSQERDVDLATVVTRAGYGPRYSYDASWIWTSPKLSRASGIWTSPKLSGEWDADHAFVSKRVGCEPRLHHRVSGM